MTHEEGKYNYIQTKTLSYINTSLIIFASILSFVLNLNAFIYLLPILFIEIKEGTPLIYTTTIK